MKFEPQLHKLPNGLTVILDPMDVASTCVTVCFDTGSRDENPNEYGITHFCEHMLCEGTKRFNSSSSINDFIENKSGVWNASTSDNYLQLYGRIIHENTDVLLDVFSDMIQNSVFDLNKIEKERGSILDELRRAQDNERRQELDFINNKLLNGQFSSYRTLGTAENIKSFTPEQLKQWIASRISAKNCVICVSGKIESPDKLLKQIQMRYAFMPSHPVAKKSETARYTPGTGHLTFADKNNIIAMIAVPELWKKSKENVFPRMCVSRFESWFNKNLYETLRQDKGLVYGIKKFSYGPDSLRLTGLQTTARPETLQTVLATIAQTANTLYNEKHITPEFLARLRNSFKLGDADFLESNEKRVNRLVFNYLDFGELYDFYSIVEMSESMTVDDVIKYSRGYFERPVSIITTGANHNVDVMSVWQENSGNLSQTKQLSISKERECR